VFHIQIHVSSWQYCEATFVEGGVSIFRPSHDLRGICQQAKVLKMMVSKDSLFSPRPPSRNGEISLFSFEVFVNKWKVPKVLKILVSKDSLFSHLKEMGEISLFSKVLEKP